MIQKANLEVFAETLLDLAKKDNSIMVVTSDSRGSGKLTQFGKELPNQIANMNKPLYNFLINKWYFDELYEVIFIKPSKKIGLFLWKFCDGKIIDGFGPDGFADGTGADQCSDRR